MKNLMVFSIACLVVGYAGAQKLEASAVPAAVKSSFSKAFPNAKEVKWSKESDKEIEAEFESAGKEMSATFSPAGVWMGTETEIKNSDLPKAVQAAIAKEFAGYKLKESEKAEAPGKAAAYEVELAEGEALYEVQFSADGKVIKKEEKKKEGKEDKD